MRYLLILLLVINIIFFGWIMTHPYSKKDRVLPPVPADVTHLQLLNERDMEVAGFEAADQSSQKTATPAESQKATRSCYTLGPLLREKSLKELQARMDELGYQGETRAIEQQETSGYWVFLPPYESRKVALEMAAELARKGIKDYYVVTDKEMRNAVSLGLFSDKARANRRMAHIRTLGYQPRKTVRYRDRTYYWLDYDEFSDRPLPDEVWADLGSEKQKVQRLDRSCD